MLSARCCTWPVRIRESRGPIRMTAHLRYFAVLAISSASPRVALAKTLDTSRSGLLIFGEAARNRGAGSWRRRRRARNRSQIEIRHSASITPSVVRSGAAILDSVKRYTPRSSRAVCGVRSFVRSGVTDSVIKPGRHALVVTAALPSAQRLHAPESWLTRSRCERRPVWVRDGPRNNREMWESSSLWRLVR